MSIPDDPFSSFSEPASFLGLDPNSRDNNPVSLEFLSGLPLSRDEASDQIKGNNEGTKVTIKVIGSTVFAQYIEGQSAEKLEQAVAEGNIGIMDTSVEGAPDLKLPAHKVREMEALGITSVEVHSPSGVRTFTSFNIQALSDKELDLLITNLRTQIVLLKAQAQKDPEDEGLQQKIAKLETKLSGLVVERAIRKNDPHLQEIIALHVESNYSTEMMLMKMWAEQKAIRESQQHKIEEQYWESKHIQELKQESRQNRMQQVAKQVFLKQELASSEVVDKEAKSLNPPVSVIDVGRFISLYTKLKNAA